MIYFLCGHRGCGKNFLANQIAKENPVKIIDTGPIIRSFYNKYKYDNESFGKWIKKNEEKYGADFSNRLINKSVLINKSEDYIVIGYRSMEGIKYFNDNFKIKNYIIFYIDGDYELFRNNYNNREKTNISKEEYEEIVEVEDTMGINKVKEFVIKNKENGKYYYKTENNDMIFQDVLREINKKNLYEER